MTLWFNASASYARGPGFEIRWEHSSFSLKSPDFVPVAPRVAFSGMGQARIENNLFIYLSFICSLMWGTTVAQPLTNEKNLKNFESGSEFINSCKEFTNSKLHIIKSPIQQQVIIVLFSINNQSESGPCDRIYDDLS